MLSQLHHRVSELELVSNLMLDMVTVVLLRVSYSVLQSATVVLDILTQAFTPVSSRHQLVLVSRHTPKSLLAVQEPLPTLTSRLVVDTSQMETF